MGGRAMTRQSKHKRRITRRMLARTAWFRRAQKLARVYAKARAEQESKT